MYSQKNFKRVTIIVLASALLLFFGLCQFILSQYHKEELNFNQLCQLVFNETITEYKSIIIEQQLNALNSNKHNDTYSNNSNNAIVSDISARVVLNKTKNIGLDTIDNSTRIDKLQNIQHNKTSNNNIEEIKYQDEIVLQFKDLPTLKHDFLEILNNIKDLNTNEEQQNAEESLTTMNSDLNYKLIRLSQSIVIEGNQDIILKNILPQIIFALVVFCCIIFALYVARRSIKIQIAIMEQKDDLMSSISHELKTPVATTKLILDAIKNFNIIDDRDKTEQYIGMAQWEVNRLELMIEKTMNLLLSEKGQLHLQIERLEVNKLISTITTMLQPLANKNNKKILYFPFKAPIFVEADRLHLNNAIYNLIDNAIKYGGDTIEIHILQKHHHVLIKIKDSGTGLSKEQRSRVFDKFFRVANGNKYSIKGHGIGLSYCKQIIELLHGKLYLDHTLETTFIIELPINLENEV